MAPKDDSPISTLLRKSCIATYPFAFALGIAHAATSHDGLFPAITLVPQTASVIFSAFVLYFDAVRRKKHAQHHGGLSVSLGDDQKKKKTIRNIVTILGDLSCAATLLTCLVFAWITLSYNRGYGYGYGYYYGAGSDEAVLGTYATVPFMINMTIHFFFILQTIYLSLPAEFFTMFSSTPVPTTCPNCQHNLTSTAAARWHGDKNSGGYDILNPEESDSLYRDIERQTGGRGFGGRVEGVEGEAVGGGKGTETTRPSEETAREISETEVLKIVDV